jgi:hypothetical protein
MKGFPRTRLLVTLAIAMAALGCKGKPAEQQELTGTPPPTPEVGQTAGATPPPVVSAPAPNPNPNKPKPQPPNTAPAPAPSRPEPIVRTLAAGTELQVALDTPVSSKTSQVGETVRAHLTQPLIIDGMTAIPEGASVVGTVTEAVPVKKIGGAASVGVRFDAVELPGQTVVIDASIQEKAKSETGKDAGTIAGATAGGAILGRVLSKHDKTKGTIIGAVVGAAAGTGAAVATKGKEVEFAPGTPFVLKLEDATNVTVQR